VPLSSKLVAMSREWKLKCPGRDRGKKDRRGRPIREPHLVFPNGEGNVLWHTNVIQDGLIPTLIAAGVTVAVLNSKGSLKVRR